MPHNIDYVCQLGEAIISNIEKVIIGKHEIIEKTCASVLAAVHILFEDVPGVGKTVLCKALAKSVDGSFSRVQCTPDLLPSDIVGAVIYRQNSGEFVFNRGPIFSNILLADEINRTTPKTQSALLECMEEQQATVSGHSYALPRPFIVVATQNPIEYEGTFPLPEAQLDRFAVKLTLGYPSEEAEKQFLQDQRLQHPLELLKPVCTIKHVQTAVSLVKEVAVEDSVCQYIISLVNATRRDPRLVLGAGPRASQTLYRLSQALAALRGRDYVLPDDVKELAPNVLEHRLILSVEEDFSPKALIQELLENLPVL
ncbi:MoxR family ATPase [bacterium]|nr:MoxR family ATPase [bacterium]